VAHAEKGYQIALQMEQLNVIVGAYQNLGLCWLTLDDEQGCDHLEKCLAISLATKQYWSAAALYPNLVMHYVDNYQLERAEQLINEGVRFMADFDMDSSARILEAWQVMVHLHRGRWAECQDAAGAL
jgi:hypothetical protein